MNRTSLAVLLLLGCSPGTGQDHQGTEHPGSATPAPEAGHGGGGADHAALEGEGAAGAAPKAVVEVAQDVARLLDIRTEVVIAGPISSSRRAPATVAWDPLEVTRLTAQPGGQVRGLTLPRAGESVRRGQVVAQLYQPEIRAAFEELRVAARLGEPWVTAARSRLVASGVAEAEVDAALAAGTVPDTFAVRSLVAGFVLQHTVKEGTWVSPGGVIGVVGDPDAVIVDMVVTGAAPAPGTVVTLRDPATSAEWPARVASLLPTADAAGVQVRVIPDRSPPIGLPLVAEWSEPVTGGLWVPQTALVDTGERRVVFVETGPGRFESRAVVVGVRADERVQILEGLADGERVVVAGTFLLDSETQIGSAGHSGHGG